MSVFRLFSSVVKPGQQCLSSLRTVTKCIKCYSLEETTMCLSNWNFIPNSECSLPSIMYDQRRNYAKRGIVKEKKGKSPKYEMSDEELSKLINVEEFEALLSGVVSKLKTEYTVQLSLRVGLGIETLPVELDGSVHPLKDVAQISRKPPNIIVLNLSALPDAIKPVLNAINKSGMNLAPQIDGVKIFLTIPKITREHRENLAKSAKTLFNSAKQEITQLQNKYTETARLPTAGISQDTVKDAVDNIRYRAQESIGKCEELFKLKTKELVDG